MLSVLFNEGLEYDEEDFKHHFLRDNFSKIIPDDSILADFGCSLQLDAVVRGRVYFTYYGFYFYSNLFGFITTAECLWEDVVDIKKERAAFLLPISIQIFSSDKAFFFSFLQYRDKIFSVISLIWNNMRSPNPEPSDALLSNINSILKTDLSKTNSKSFDKGSDSPCSSSRTTLNSPSVKGEQSEEIDKNSDSSTHLLLAQVKSANPKYVSDYSSICTCQHEDSKLILSKKFQASPSTLKFLMFQNSSPVLETFSKIMGLQNFNIIEDFPESSDRETKIVSYSLQVGFPFSAVLTQTTQEFSPPGIWVNDTHYSVQATSVSQNAPYCDSFKAIINYCFKSITPDITELQIFMRIEYIKNISSMIKGIINTKSLSKSEEYVKTLLKTVDNYLLSNDSKKNSNYNEKLLKDEPVSINFEVKDNSRVNYIYDLFDLLKKLMVIFLNLVPNILSKNIINSIVITLLMMLLVNQILVFNSFLLNIQNTNSKLDRLINIFEDLKPVMMSYFDKNANGCSCPVTG